MNSQQGEFTFPPVSHKHDPSTSKEGAREVTRSGRRASQANRVMDAVRTFPGLTAGEIGTITELGHVRAQRRLSDLKNLDKVFADGKMKFEGNNQSRWWPTKRGEYDNR